MEEQQGGVAQDVSQDSGERKQTDETPNLSDEGAGGTDESSPSESPNEQEDQTDDSEVDRPLLRKVVSTPAGVVQKTVKSTAKLTKTLATKTGNLVKKNSREDDKNGSKKALDNHAEENEKPSEIQPEDIDCFGRVACAKDAVGKPIEEVEKVFERPGKRKYKKVDRPDEKDRVVATADEAIAVAEEAVEKPLEEVEKVFERPGKRKYKKVDRPDEKDGVVATADEAIAVAEEKPEEEAVIGEANDAKAESVSQSPTTSESEEKVVTEEETKDESDKSISLGPVMEFLLRDSTIIVGSALMVALTPTIMYWTSIVQNQIPFPVSMGWVVAAYVVGDEFGRRRGPRSAMSEEDVTEKRVSGVARRAERSHSIFMGATRRLSQDHHVKFAEEPLPPQKKRKKHKKFWSAERFSLFRRRQKWRRHMTPTKSSRLQEWLDNDETLRTCQSNEPTPVKDDIVADEALPDPTSSMGAFDLTSSPAKSLAETGIEPLLSLRGMDIFLPAEDSSQDDLGNHPFLINEGLRKTRTCLVNVMLPWANMCIYFQLPEWFHDFDNVVENEDDPDDVKALKRFINGDDEYRNQRLRLLPSVVEGPRIIKYLAPQKTELAMPQALVPVTWNKLSGTTDSDGSELCPLVEVEIDCISNKAMRAMAVVFKRNFRQLTLDLAVLIRAPDDAKDEPGAVLGMWRFDQIDVATCPVLPDREEDEEEVIRRATEVLSLSPEEMKEIAQVA